MEALKAMPPAEGSAVVSSVEVVSKVLPKNSSNIFLKNIGVQPQPKKGRWRHSYQLKDKVLNFSKRK